MTNKGTNINKKESWMEGFERFIKEPMTYAILGIYYGLYGINIMVGICFLLWIFLRSSKLRRWYKTT